MEIYKSNERFIKRKGDLNEQKVGMLLQKKSRYIWGAVCVKIVFNWGIYKSPFLFI